MHIIDNIYFIDEMYRKALGLAHQDMGFTCIEYTLLGGRKKNILEFKHDR